MTNVIPFRRPTTQSNPPSFWWMLLIYWAPFLPFWIGVASGVAVTLLIQFAGEVH